MKHKRFDQVYPYTYYLCEIHTGRKYHGVRWANCKLQRTPNGDFGISYFTSGKLSKLFKENPEKFDFRLCWTFDSIEEARDYESKINTRLMIRKDWEVWNNSKVIINTINPRQGVLVRGSETALKISKANSGKKRTEECKKQNSIIQKNKVKEKTHYFCSVEHSKKTSERMKQNNPSKNGLSEDHKIKIGLSQKGKPKGPQSESHRLNNSLSRKGKVPWNKGKKTGPVSEETKKKHTLSRTGQKRGKYTLHKEPHGTKHLQGKKACCLCCHREFNLGNLAKHLRKKDNESTI
jgi:hypothetical protein